MTQTRFNGIVFDKQYVFDKDTDYITEEGKAVIDAYLHKEYFVCALGLGDWRWKSMGGRFTVRLSKYVKENFGKNLSKESLQLIGDLYHRYHIKDEGYDFDFTNDFNWRAGEYGDDGSCFWGGRRASRLMLERGGAYAVRLYKTSSDGSRVGYARAWMYDLEDSSCVAVFNAYGIDTEKLARVVAEWSGQTSVKRIERPIFYDGNDKHDGVFINNKSSVFVVGPYNKKQVYMRLPYIKHADPCRICGRLTDNRVRGMYACKEHAAEIEALVRDHALRAQKIEDEALARRGAGGWVVDNDQWNGYHAAFTINAGDFVLQDAGVIRADDLRWRVNVPEFRYVEEAHGEAPEIVENEDDGLDENGYPEGWINGYMEDDWRVGDDEFIDE